MRTIKSKVAIGAVVGVGLVVVVVAAVVLLFDANQLRPRLEQAMGDALGRSVHLGNIRVALLSGGVVVDDLSIADDPQFSDMPFVTAKRVAVGVDLLPLITSRTLRVETFTLEQPQVALRQNAAGEWNVARLGAARPTEPTPSGDAARNAGNRAAAVAGVFVRQIAIADGRVVIARPPSQGARDNAESVYQGVNLTVNDLSLTTQFPFHFSASTPGGGSVALDGQAGPVNMADTPATPFQGTLAIKHLNIAAAGLADPAAGLAGSLDFMGMVSAEGGRLSSNGALTATGLQLVAGGSPLRVPIEIDYQSDYSTSSRDGAIMQGDVHIGKAVAHLTGTYSLAGETPTLAARLAGPGLAAPELEAALPAIGLGLPSGASLKGGTIDVNLAIDGPADRLVIAGPITMANATLSGFDLGGKMGAMASFAGLPTASDTEIERLGLTLRIAPEGTTVDDLALVVPAIGSMSGSGRISPAGALDFAMAAKLTKPVGAAGSLTRVASGGQDGGLPFHVRGTTSTPTFSPDVKAVAGNLAKDSAVKAAGALGGSKAAGAASVLSGLFGGKKK